MNNKFSMKNSLSKLLLLAGTTIFTIGCSDYLADFQDKYDDGKAFADSSDNKENTDSSSSNEGSGDTPKSSSSKGNGASNTGDLNSSSSNNSGESPDVESSSSIEAKTETYCNGTTIFEEGTSLKYGRFTKQDHGMPYDYSSGINFEDDILHWILTSETSDDWVDVSEWGGLCFEYSATANFAVTLYSAPSPLSMRYGITMSDVFQSQENGAVSLAWDKWNLGKTAIDSGATYNDITKKTNVLVFEKVADQGSGNIHIKKITTINDVTDPFENIIPAASSDACGGTVIFGNDSIQVGTGFIEGIGNSASYTKDYIAENGQAINLYLSPTADSKNDTITYNITSWKGVCIEYSSETDLKFSVSDTHPVSGKSTSSSEFTLNSTDGQKKVAWLQWSEALDQNVFSAATALNIWAKPNTETYNSKKYTIHKVTTLNKRALTSPYWTTYECPSGNIFDANKNNWAILNGKIEPFGDCGISGSKQLTVNFSTNPSSDCGIQTSLTDEKSMDISNWRGLCLEYTSNNHISAILSLDPLDKTNAEPGRSSAITLPKNPDFYKKAVWFPEDSFDDPTIIKSKAKYIGFKQSTLGNSLETATIAIFNRISTINTDVNF